MILEEFLDMAGRVGNNQLDSREKVGLIRGHSCKNSNTAQSPVTRCSEASLATVWKSLVCRMYNFDNRELVESWNKYVSATC
jgi:hypothetical protein